MDLNSLLREYTDYEDERYYECSSSSENEWPVSQELEEDIKESQSSQTITVRRKLRTSLVQNQENIAQATSTKSTYACQLCDRLYISVAGFRGHVIKKHDRPDIKGKYQHHVFICQNIKISFRKHYWRGM